MNPLPTASISSTATSVCAGGSISLSINTGADLSYQWKLNTVARVMVTQTEDGNRSQVNVYQNPSESGIFTIRYEHNVIIAIEIMDTQEQKVFEVKEVADDGEYRLSL